MNHGLILFRHILIRCDNKLIMNYILKHQFAKNGIKRMKMLRHPNILMYQDGIENDKCIYIVTERVQPLYNYLRDSKDSDSHKENEIVWGLYQIAVNKL